jgi:hypothetical protein
VFGSATCCKAEKYNFFYSGDIDATLTSFRLGIRPVSQGSKTLPFIAYSNAITDEMFGTVKIVTGSFKVSMSAGDVLSFKNNLALAKAAFSQALAKTLQTDLNLQDSLDGRVFILKMIFPARRRLESENVRRLQDDVSIDYEIISENTTLTVDASTLNKATLAQNIKDKATSNGLPISTVTVPEIAETTEIEVFNEPKAPTSDAPRSLFSVVAVFIALGAHLLFAGASTSR